MERRTVFQLFGLSALAIGGVAACSTPATGGTASTAAGSAAALRIPLSDIPVGGGVIRADDKVVVTQATAGTYKAFSAVCQHQGCIVATIQGKNIVCPCHGSAYSIVDGSVVNGPTTKPLIPKTATTDGSDLVVT
jgi:Rieske Fe-S protein